MAIMKPENMYAGRMLAYLEYKGMAIPKIDYSLENWELIRNAIKTEIKGNDPVDNIARFWLREYQQKPIASFYFHSGDINKAYFEARDYLRMLGRIAQLSSMFWENVGGMPDFVKGALQGEIILPPRSRYLFAVLFDLPKNGREECYIRLAHLMNDWNALSVIGKRKIGVRQLWEIIEP